jgi:hypothetical protein
MATATIVVAMVILVLPPKLRRPASVPAGAS